ncbi:MAG: hypothetical protein K0S18_37 [Anaerocolumna sp.]|jgi:(p)ppGpp synthase/HD superfamily hydrolase|nr:hypothetical protein [Anaerocolumna sp.]
MGLDREPIKIANALKIAKEYYNEKTYQHALRVMQYVADNEMIQSEYKDECVALAIMHDLLEDTDFNSAYFPEYFNKALKLLTKPKEQDYIDYIKNIKDTGYTNWRMCAYWVKLADMKDHLAQTETLTDKLKEKYLKALPYLL